MNSLYILGNFFFLLACLFGLIRQSKNLFYISTPTSISWTRHWQERWVWGAAFMACVELAGSQTHVRDDLLQAEGASESVLKEQLLWALCEWQWPPSSPRVWLEGCVYPSHFLRHLAGSAPAAGNGLGWGDPVMLDAIVPDWGGHRTVDSTPPLTCRAESKS